ncbi:LETM1 and EF-hand domain-containing protein 1-like protein [Leptotrombidium deliense]|uniref:Mitochondrial proton/calcium exchanger protein n=1 Tax=Leptotrombidium deliense TaxID=299467 RepID=A0A443SSJ6_9ACAR|nr:LETM1 and EF-hand domain-containing protein 1-like protein [Leptotrombidium deliense]
MFTVTRNRVPYSLWSPHVWHCKRNVYTFRHQNCLRLKYARLAAVQRNREFSPSLAVFQIKNILNDFDSRRHLTTTVVLYEKDSSKVETAVKALKEEKQIQEAASTSVVTKPETAVAKPKRSIWKRIWDELVHYYHGFRLLWLDTKILKRLIWKILNGESLTRREHRQMVRTVADLFRLVPFLAFIILPFMEFLLPVFLKLFPNMLPSTFQTASDKEAKMKAQLRLKLDMAKFLQKTLDEMALKAPGETHSHSAKQFVTFLDNVRTWIIRKTGAQTSNEEILKFSKLFENELTLDALTRPQLTALCRLLELKPIGTNNFLRFQLEMKLRSLQADDATIQKEGGISSLTVPELQQACRARGMRALGVPEERLRTQLQQWLELSLNKNIPSSLLLLSRVLYLPEDLPAPDQLKATILSLPEVAATEARYKIGETEGRIDNKTKIEVIKQEEEAIKKEKEEMELAKKEKLVDTAKPIVDTAVSKPDVAVEMKVEEIATAEPAKEKVEDKTITHEEITSLERAVDELSKEKHKFILEKEELEDLKEEMEEYKEDIDEFKELTAKTGKKELVETKAAKRLRKRVSKMLTGLDKVYSNLESKKADLQAQIDTLVKEGKEGKSEKDNLVSINDLHATIKKIQKVEDDSKLKKIVDILDMIDVDNDGLVEVEHISKLIEVLEREQIQISPDQLKDVINVLIEEEKLEDEKKLLKSAPKPVDDKKEEKSL